MKICIDAGHNHSGFDTGATANGLKEQDITFRIALLLQKKLEKAGVNTVMTRKTNTENLGSSVSTSIARRVAISNKNNCDYFVSLHCNAGGGTGTEVLVYKKGGNASQLAEKILTSLTTLLPLQNRGIKEANLGVLRDTDCPAVLVETAFLDHPADAALLQQKEDVFANAVFRGILEYANIPFTLPTDDIKTFLAEKWNLSHPEEVFRLLDTHPYRDTLYQKIYESY